MWESFERNQNNRVDRDERLTNKHCITMMFYSNILASSYKFYSRFKRENPYFMSVLIVALCQMSVPLFIISITKRFLGILIIPVVTNKYYYLPFIIIWILLDYRYYSRDKVAKIMVQFDQKNTGEKRLWAYITVFSLLVLFVIIPLLLAK